MRIYSIYDSLSEKWGALFEQENDACAIRAVRLAHARQGGVLGEDFTLFCVGDFREGRMHLVADEPVRIIIPQTKEN